jgi:hypothetical protein
MAEFLSSPITPDKERLVWTKHGEIDDTLHEVDTGVGDNNSDDVFEGPEKATRGG